MGKDSNENCAENPQGHDSERKPAETQEVAQSPASAGQDPMQKPSEIQAARSSAGSVPDTMPESGGMHPPHTRDSVCKPPETHETARSSASAGQDSAWKDVIVAMLEDFFAFFFPVMHADIDFSKGYTFLDKELQKILRDDAVGKRYVDTLVKVFLKTGEVKWLLIHIEVQGYREKDLAERIFIYNYLIFNRYKRDVISCVLLTDDDPAYRPNRHVRELWGFRQVTVFPLVKLIDYRTRRQELAESSNPFGLVVEAVLRYSDGRGDLNRLYGAKRELIRILYKRGFTKKRIRAVLKFIDWLIRMPEELEEELEEEIAESGGRKSMPYVTSWERRAAKKAAIKAREEGIKEKAVVTAKKMLAEGLPVDMISRVTDLSEDEVLELKSNRDSQ